MAGTAATAAASLLEIERDRLLCSLQHLDRSVKELKEALAEDPDPEYKAAISENLVVIAKQRARVACLEDEIKRAKGMKADISQSQVAAVTWSEAGQYGQQQAHGSHTAAGHLAASAQASLSRPSQQHQLTSQHEAGDAMEVDPTQPGGSTPANDLEHQNPTGQACPTAAESATVAAAAHTTPSAAGIDEGGEGVWL